jgi:hypothetical protein
MRDEHGDATPGSGVDQGNLPAVMRALALVIQQQTMTPENEVIVERAMNRSIRILAMHGQDFGTVPAKRFTIIASRMLCCARHTGENAQSIMLVRSTFVRGEVGNSGQQSFDMMVISCKAEWSLERRQTVIDTLTGWSYVNPGYDFEDRLETTDSSVDELD